MRKSWVLVLGLLFVAAVPARAGGGGAVLDFDREFYVPGDVVRAYTPVWLQSTQGRLEDGPYFAFLHRPTLDYPRLPADALRVAAVDLVPRPAGDYGDASVEFVLPALEPGRYALTLCNDGCEKRLGDSVSSELVVAADEAEGRMVMAMERMSLRLRTLRIRLSNRVLGGRDDSLRGRVSALESDVEGLTSAIEELQVAAKTPVERPDADRSSSLSPLLVFVVPAALLGVFAGRHYRKPA